MRDSSVVVRQFLTCIDRLAKVMPSQISQSNKRSLPFSARTQADSTIQQRIALRLYMQCSLYLLLFINLSFVPFPNTWAPLFLLPSERRCATARYGRSSKEPTGTSSIFSWMQRGSKDALYTTFQLQLIYWPESDRRSVGEL